MVVGPNGGGAEGKDYLPPAGAADDWTVPQATFTPLQHATWDRLFARQRTMLRGRAVEDHHRSLDILELSRPGIPDFDELNERLQAATGWTVVAVPSRVPNHIFHGHLAARRFPAGNFIRSPDQLGYLREPDVFHDVFGHVPLLAQPDWADFIQEMGKLGLMACEAGTISRLAQLYWYTVEFGLCREEGQLRIYGAGIVSSYDESIHALESPDARRLEFDLERLLRTRYRINHFQQVYFVIDRFKDLLKIVRDADVPALLKRMEDLDDLEPLAPLPGDRAVTLLSA
jgi:phenylalanine-4-hydroxylase